MDYFAFPSYPEFRNISANKANRDKLRKLISKADIVVCSDDTIVIWLVTECFMQGKRCLWGLHTDMLNRSQALGIPSILIKMLYYFGSYLSDITFTTSYIFMEKLKEMGFKINFVMDQDFKCADFKVNDDPGEISQLRKTLLCEGTNYIALYAGRLSKEKRIELLFQALPENVTLLIVGNGPDKVTLQKLETHYKNVKLIPKMVSQDILRKFYKAADFHVSASNGETYGMTVREALYCGTPVVVQNDGGFIEQVRPYVDGFLVDFSDSDMAKSVIIKTCSMLEIFRPCPQHNDVVNLTSFISNQGYKRIEPFSKIKRKRIVYFAIAIVQYFVVFLYYIVAFFSNVFSFCTTTF